MFQTRERYGGRDVHFETTGGKREREREREREMAIATLMWMCVPWSKAHMKK